VLTAFAVQHYTAGLRPCTHKLPRREGRRVENGVSAPKARRLVPQAAHLLGGGMGWL